MFSLTVYNTNGKKHTLFFNTEKERDAFLEDPCYFLTTIAIKIPFVCQEVKDKQAMVWIE